MDKHKVGVCSGRAWVVGAPPFFTYAYEPLCMCFYACMYYVCCAFYIRYVYINIHIIYVGN